MTILITIMLTMINASCDQRQEQNQSAEFMEQTADKPAEVVNETLDLNEEVEVAKEERSQFEDSSTPPIDDEDQPKSEDKEIIEAEAKAKTDLKTEDVEKDREWPIEKKMDTETRKEVSQEETSEEEVLKGDLNSDDEKSSNSAKPDHQLFDQLLSKHVSATGVVNYKGFQADEAKLDQYLDDLSSHPVQGSWSRNEQLAYWINAYNAFTVKLILDHYPVQSIRDISNGEPWDKKWIELGGQTYSLNQIENEIIRPQFNEPRIHFAVNCAAQSCPPLANKAFTADNMNSLLEKQTKSFINNDKYNKIQKKKIEVSKIFDWYGKDFDDKIAFLNKYSDTKIDADAAISYTEYDWSLNN
ncbi:DUF547 domain-containing protein [Portibacter marinus]|uniref:DUF547 domain-containing protein n=1 Tax=Portibacter marinus TaxID=2898660 RepID=UPI001F463B10|nr:DUF547 domain-containing protein [Portibacter marinus]